MIEVKNLQKAFGGNMVLKGVTETIERAKKSPSSVRRAEEKAPFCGA